MENELDILLGRYYEGQTTCDEERRIVQLLAADNSRRHDADRAVLGLLAAQRRLAARPKPTAANKRTVWAVAASIAILLGIVGWMMMNRHATEAQGTEEVLAKENPVREKTTEENPVRDDLCAAQGLNPGNENKKVASSPSGEASLKTDNALIAKHKDKKDSPQPPDSPTLLAQAETELQTELPVADNPRRASYEYEQTAHSIRQRGERLMSRLMASNTTETVEQYN